MVMLKLTRNQKEKSVAKKQASTAGQVGRFGLVGIMNTVIDYVLFIGLTKAFSIPLDRVWTAKLVSGTVAMANSFYWNRKFVFKRDKVKGEAAQAQLVRFVVSTLIGTYVIQTSLVQLFTTGLPQLGEFGYHVLVTIGIVGIAPNLFTEAFVVKTAAFGLATLGSMTWNFLLYKLWAFKS
jgi:putative flippase GtrA